MFAFLLGGLGRYIAIGGIIVMAAAGAYAFCKIQSCRLHKAQVEARAAKAELKIVIKDAEDAKKIHGLSDGELVDVLRSGGLYDSTKHRQATP